MQEQPAPAWKRIRSPLSLTLRNRIARTEVLNLRVAIAVGDGVALADDGEFVRHRGEADLVLVTADVDTGAGAREASGDASGELTGTLSGLTLRGTRTTHRIGNSPEDPACKIDETYTGPVTYVFSPDGNAKFTAGPNQRESTFSGSCSGSSSGTTPVTEGTAKRSAAE